MSLTRAQRRRQARLEKKKRLLKKQFDEIMTPLIEESLMQHHLSSPDCGLFEVENRPDGCYCAVCGFPIVVLTGESDDL